MDLQFFIVIIIGIVVGFLLARAIYRFFFTGKRSSGCGGCTGCDAPKKESPPS